MSRTGDLHDLAVGLVMHGSDELAVGGVLDISWMRGMRYLVIRAAQPARRDAQRGGDEIGEGPCTGRGWGNRSARGVKLPFD